MRYNRHLSGKSRCCSLSNVLLEQSHFLATSFICCGGSKEEIQATEDMSKQAHEGKGAAATGDEGKNVLTVAKTFFFRCVVALKNANWLL